MPLVKAGPFIPTTSVLQDRASTTSTFSVIFLLLFFLPQTVPIIYSSQPWSQRYGLPNTLRLSSSRLLWMCMQGLLQDHSQIQHCRGVNCSHPEPTNRKACWRNFYPTWKSNPKPNPCQPNPWPKTGPDLPNPTVTVKSSMFSYHPRQKKLILYILAVSAKAKVS